jgi:hypothetical protein
MADAISFFFGPDDEIAWFRRLEPLRLSIYPEILEPDEAPVTLTGTAGRALTLPSYYLAAEEIGPIEIYAIKRGPNRGRFAIDEIRSPVIHYERSERRGEELIAGRVWAELVVAQNPAANVGKSDAFRQLFLKIRDELHRLQRSQPVGAFVGPQAARLSRAGMRLRGTGRHGKIYRPFR